jgi:hypothetical protein
MQNFNGKNADGDMLDMNLVPRFHAGVFTDIPLAPEFHFQPGLTFVTKGSKAENDFLGVVDVSAEYNLSYLELPLNLLYKPKLGTGNLFIGFGPYLAYGVAGNAKFKAAGLSTEEKIEFTNKHEGILPTEWKYFKPFDYGGNLFFGYQFANGLLFSLDTQLGLAKINSDSDLQDNETIFRNTGFGFSLGYSF